MSGGMIPDRTDACELIYLCSYLLPQLQFSLNQITDVDMRLALFLCITDIKDNAVCNQLPFVTNLPAGFSIKRGCIQYYPATFAGIDPGHSPAILIEGGYRTFLLQTFITTEFRKMVSVGDIGQIDIKLAGRPCTFTLFSHAFVESVRVQC